LEFASEAIVVVCAAQDTPEVGEVSVLMGFSDFVAEGDDNEAEK
jgi:hypothetical protein